MRGEENTHEPGRCLIVMLMGKAIATGITITATTATTATTAVMATTDATATTAITATMATMATMAIKMETGGTGRARDKGPCLRPSTQMASAPVSLRDS
ncbi:MAG: hypothetical protein ACI4PG_07685 [Candidatus Ventricola sp.]